MTSGRLSSTPTSVVSSSELHYPALRALHRAANASAAPLSSDRLPRRRAGRGSRRGRLLKRRVRTLVSEARPASYLHSRLARSELLLLGAKRRNFRGPRGSGGISSWKENERLPCLDGSDFRTSAPTLTPSFVVLLIGAPEHSRDLILTLRTEFLLRHIKRAYPAAGQGFAPRQANTGWWQWPAQGSAWAAAPYRTARVGAAAHTHFIRTATAQPVVAPDPTRNSWSNTCFSRSW